MINPNRVKNGKLSKTYRAWSAMKQRCMNPNKPNWKYYGGRGITVCPAWESFDEFFKDMGEAPEGLWLERRDNDGGYEPGNCYWATLKEQAQNRRKTGPAINPDSLRQKCIRAGMNYHAVYQRMMWGWEEGKALSVPMQKVGGMKRDDRERHGLV